MIAKQKKQPKKYLIALEEKHSIIALAAGILVLCCALSAILVALEEDDATGEPMLHYFTFLSNLLNAIGAAFMIPYAADGITKKRFSVPRFVALFQFAGVTCVTITMVTTLCIIIPVQGVEFALADSGFWLHLVCPLCTLVLFQCIETGISLTRKEGLIVLVPYWAYMLLYYIEVIIIGKENGGWSDFYMTQAFWPAWVSLILMLALGFIVFLLLLKMQKRRSEQTWKDIARMWQDDLEPAELLTEAFGLGRFIGSRRGKLELTVPLDIFALMSERYGIPLEKLTKAFVKGALDAVKDRQRIENTASIGPKGWAELTGKEPADSPDREEESGQG